MNKLRLRREIFSKIINIIKEDLSATKVKVDLSETFSDQQYALGKKHALEDVLHKIEVMERFPDKDEIDL